MEFGHVGIESALDPLESSRTRKRVSKKVIILSLPLESLEVCQGKLKFDLLGFLGLILGNGPFEGVGALKVHES